MNTIIFFVINTMLWMGIDNLYQFFHWDENTASYFTINIIISTIGGYFITSKISKYMEG